MTANAEIVLEEFADSLLVPEAAVTYDARTQRRRSTSSTRRAETGRRRVPVKVGVGNGTRSRSSSGLKAGDKVVLPGLAQRPA